MAVFRRDLLTGILFFLLPTVLALAQTAQKGADLEQRGEQKLRFEYVGYRAARYETEKVVEPENERPNRGGLICVYFTNVTAEPVPLAFWRANGKDESHWRLGAFLAWDRLFNDTLEPGQTTVLEIDAVSEHFAPEKPFTISFVDRTWRPAGSCKTTLREDPVQISYIHVLPGMKAMDVFVRHTGMDAINLISLEVLGRRAKVTRWVGQHMAGPSMAIARLELAGPLAPSDLILVKLGVQSGGRTRFVYAHRRAFEDWFPIGCWSNNPETYQVLRRLHIDTVVRGGSADDEFYTQVAPRYGFRTMVPSGKPVSVDTIRSLGDHPAVACWMLSDEPDWGTQPDVMFFVDRTVRAYNCTKPTFITLCRNVKFFEYAQICDIPCMDHYCVTAPTSSKWPHSYGTHLEETAYYTRDLKAASEPKPIWVWSQAIADWEERPKRPVPTPEELAAQLMLNLGRGAKGILWFNYDHAVAEKYPDTREAMQGWGRVLRMVRNDLLGADPFNGDPKGPSELDVALLVSYDKVFVIVTNLDYEIDDAAYPFASKKDVTVHLDLPEWVSPATALRLSAAGVSKMPFTVRDTRATVNVGDLEVCAFVVLAADPGTEAAYTSAYAKAIEDEHRDF